MRAVNYNEVLQLLSELAGIPYADLPTATALTYRGAISRWFRKAWEVEYWPELTRTDKRYYRPAWVTGTTYTAGTEVYLEASGGYFQAIRSPAPTVSTLTRSGYVVTVTTSAPHFLLTGDFVTVSGANQSNYNVAAAVTVTGVTTFTYTIASNSITTPATGTIRAWPWPANADGDVAAQLWYPCLSEYTEDIAWTATAVFDTGEVAEWNGTFYVSLYDDLVGVLPTDTTYWRALTVFDKYVAYAQTGFTAIGDVRDVYSKNPLVNKTYATSNWTLSQNGVQVPNGPAVVWLEYRTRFVPLVGGDYSASATYAVGDQILFNSSGSVKNFYTCAVATTAGQSPTTTAASWTLLEIPYLFQPYLVHGAFADVLRMDGQMDKAHQQERLAEMYLEMEAAKLFNLQPQQQRMDMSAAY